VPDVFKKRHLNAGGISGSVVFLFRCAMEMRSAIYFEDLEDEKAPSRSASSSKSSPNSSSKADIKIPSTNCFWLILSVGLPKGIFKSIVFIFESN